MFASEIRNSGILSRGIWNPQFLNPKLQLKETGMVLTIEIRNPSSIDKDWKKTTAIQNPGAKDTMGRLLERIEKFLGVFNTINE